MFKKNGIKNFIGKKTIHNFRKILHDDRKCFCYITIINA